MGLKWILYTMVDAKGQEHGNVNELRRLQKEV